MTDQNEEKGIVPKVEWPILQREKFENKLVRLGWSHGKLDRWGNPIYSMNGVDIVTDGHGIWVFVNGIRKYGLSDDNCKLHKNTVIKHLNKTPFSRPPEYVALDLETGNFISDSEKTRHDLCR